jgi:hypothetical protein
MNGTELIDLIKDEYMSKQELLDALCDGEFLGKIGATQEAVEDAWSILHDH